MDIIETLYTWKKSRIKSHNFVYIVVLCLEFGDIHICIVIITVLSMKIYYSQRNFPGFFVAFAHKFS